jgi:hypothetical protein
MTQSHTKDRIETVIFTPTTSYWEQLDYARDRIVSFDNMDELKEKLFTMYTYTYEEEEANHAPQPISSCRMKETVHAAKEGTKVPLKSILKTKNNHPGRPELRAIQMPPPRTSPSTKGSPKHRNILVRFFAAGKQGSKA